MTPIGAIFSPDRKYRYVLWRLWDSSLPKLQFIGLNPSTANEHTNDATIKKLVKITRNNGYGGFYMTNLFAVVSSKPEILLTDPDPIGDNDHHLIDIKQKVDKVVFCWGAFKEAYEPRRGGCRADQVAEMFPERYCLQHLSTGRPKHPLYCLDTQKIIPW